MTHREACYELRRTNALYAAEKITRAELFASLDRILTQRSLSANL